MPRKVVFAYRIGQRTMGGKVMRVDQLSAMAKSYLGGRYEFEVALAPKDTRPRMCNQFINACRDAIVIFHKSAAANLGAENRAKLKDVAAGICVDHLDVIAGPFEPAFIDVHIAASFESERLLFQGLPALCPAPGTQIRHLRHHADPRLRPGSVLKSDFRVGYFGLPDNVVLPPDLAQRAVVPEYDGKSDSTGFIARLSEGEFSYLYSRPEPGPDAWDSVVKAIYQGVQCCRCRGQCPSEPPSPRCGVLSGTRLPILH